jgi:hypothetical protein
MLRFVSVGCALLFATALTRAVSQPVYEENLPLEHPAIRYAQDAPVDPVSRLARNIQTGAVTLDAAPDGSVLVSLLRHLDINPDTQILVFSKTSFQHALISPRNPRAIYFNDDVAVGVVRGADVIELGAVDPRQGVMFYTLQGQMTRPTITRRDVCLKCHRGVATLGVPGFFVSSVFPSSSGIPEAAGAIVTDHRTAFEERWGGWYVTGIHGRQRHRGNAVADNPAEPTLLETEGTQNVTTLADRFDIAGYLAPGSDIVALMTFEHQTHLLNLLTRLGWEARLAQHEGTTSWERRIDARLDEVVRYFLFADEAPLDGPVTGVSSFTKTFASRGPLDRRGRSLREFDLQRRLFRYPLSYLIYSKTFDALPNEIRERLYRRLYDALSANTSESALRGMTTADRTAILEIVRDTKSGLPSYWAVRPASEP